MSNSSDDKKQEVLYGSAIAGLSGALTSLAGANPLLAATAGLAGFVLPTGLRHLIPWVKGSHEIARRILKEKMLLDYQHSVLSYPLQTHEAKERMISTLTEAGLLRQQHLAPIEVLPAHPSFWAGSVTPEVLETLRSSPPFHVNCCCTSPGFLAALETMRQLWDVPLQIDFHAASSREQLQDLAARTMEYDFLLVGGYSFMFQAAGSNPYQLLFAGMMDRQYLLTRPVEKTRASAVPSILPLQARQFEKVYLIPETANEMLFQRLAPSARRQEISIADLPGLSLNLSDGETVIAWDPNAQALVRYYGLKPVEGGGMAIPIYLAAHSRFFNKRSRIRNQQLQAFSAAFIAAWNLCVRGPEAAFERLEKLPQLWSVFGSGLGLPKG